MIILIIFITVMAIIAYNAHEKEERNKKEQQELYNEVLDYLHLSNVNSVLCEFDDKVIVKSRQTLNSYDDLKYLKERDRFDLVKKVVKMRSGIRANIVDFFLCHDFVSFFFLIVV